MKKVYLFLAEGFEEVEAITIVDILRRAELSVIMVSVTDELMVTGSHSISILADSFFEDCNFSSADMLILPGGMPGTRGLEQHLGLRKLILEFAAQDKPLAAICAAPLIFGKLGLLNNKKATCYPGYENELKGALLQSDSVVRDGNYITAQGLGSAISFALDIVRFFTNEEKADELSKGMMVK